MAFIVQSISSSILVIQKFETMMYTLTELGPIPMGYRYEAQSQSERTHMIPVDGFELANRDYRQILTELRTFICSPAGASPVSPILFAKVGFE